MRARVEAFLARLGGAGVIGIGVLTATAGFYVGVLAPARQAATAEREALERMRSRVAERAAPADARAEELRRFYQLFPPVTGLTGELERLHAAARTAGLDIAQAEYRLERRPVGLWAYQAMLPVQGNYTQVRALLSTVLHDMPTASVDGLRFDRRNAADAALEAQVRITLYARAP